MEIRQPQVFYERWSTYSVLHEELVNTEMKILGPALKDSDIPIASW